MGKFEKDAIIAKHNYTRTVVEMKDGVYQIEPKNSLITFKTDTVVPKTGLMLVGLGGNNGSTVVSGVLANKLGISWRTKEGLQHPNWFGSVIQASTVRLGATEDNEEINIPLKDMMPFVNPNDLVIGGWDINGANLADAAERAAVLPFDLQRQLGPELSTYKPLKSVYYPDFIAANQADRADNILEGDFASMEHVDQIRNDIREFKKMNDLDKVVVLWTANTERFCDVLEGVHDTGDNLLKAIEEGHEEISQSIVFAVASILEGCTYINGSPQNTLVPGIIELATKHGVFVAGDDFKSGQTKMKSVLVDFLVSAGIKPASIVSYNHLGNNDGKNLSAPQCFRSKEISKSNVVDDMVDSNQILYKKGEHPDHVVVIKYLPYVGDSKRAMDEYTSEIFMGGKNTIVMHNTCEDSLLATPIIYDLCILAEIAERIEIKKEGSEVFERFHCVLSLLSYLIKAPLVPPGTPVVNALAAQRQCIINIFRACIGLPAEHNMALEHRLPSLMSERARVKA